MHLSKVVNLCGCDLIHESESNNLSGIESSTTNLFILDARWAEATARDAQPAESEKSRYAGTSNSSNGAVERE